LKENEKHYDADLSKYSGEDFQFPENFVNDIKQYERWETGINNPEVFRFVFFSASLLTQIVMENDLWVFWYSKTSIFHQIWWLSIFISLIYYSVVDEFCTAMKIIFPDFAPFLNRYHIIIAISGSILSITGEILMRIKPCEILLLFVTAASMLQIFYVAQKRKHIEKFSKHQNATICFAKCVFLILLQLTVGCVLVLFDPNLILVGVIFHITNCNYYFFRPNKAFQIVDSISEPSWRKLIKTVRFSLNLSKKKITALWIGFLLGSIVFSTRDVILFWLGMVSGLSLAFKLGSQ
jgi:hypothetical protein